MAGSISSDIGSIHASSNDLSIVYNDTTDWSLIGSECKACLLKSWLAMPRAKAMFSLDRTHHIECLLGKAHVHSSFSYHGRVQEARRWGHDGLHHWDGITSIETQAAEHIGERFWSRRDILFADMVSFDQLL